jgi:hypothetical protein
MDAKTGYADDGKLKCNPSQRGPQDELYLTPDVPRLPNPRGRGNVSPFNQPPPAGSSGRLNAQVEEFPWPEEFAEKAQRFSRIAARELWLATMARVGK